MKMIALVAASLLCAVAAQAFDSSESLHASALSAFKAPPAAAFHFTPALRAAPAAKPTKAAEQKGTRLIRASGYLTLNGSAFVNGQGMVYVPVSGWVTLQSSEGGNIQGSVYMNGNAWISVNGGFGSGWAQPSAYISLSENGKPLGTMLVQGNINVSGFANGGWLNVSGSGYVSGQMYAQDAAPAPTPTK